MDIFGHQGVALEIVQAVGGEDCKTTINWFVEAPPPDNFSPTEVYDALVALDVFVDLRGLMSNVSSLKRIKVSTNFPPGIPPYADLLVFGLGSGTITSDVMPPNVSSRIYKFPDVAEQDPPDQYDNWRAGMIRLSGIPESQQNGGQLDSSYVADMNSWAELLERVEVRAGEYMRMHYVRALSAESPVAAAVPVLETTASNILGTQNTRKIKV